MIKDFEDFDENKLSSMNKGEINSLIATLDDLDNLDKSAIDVLIKKIEEGKKLANEKNKTAVVPWLQGFKEAIQGVLDLLTKMEKADSSFNIEESTTGNLTIAFDNNKRETETREFTARKGIYFVTRRVAFQNKLNKKLVVSNIFFNNSSGFFLRERKAFVGGPFSLYARIIEDSSDMVILTEKRGFFIKSEELEVQYDEGLGVEVKPNKNYYVYCRLKSNPRLHTLITTFRVFKENKKN